MRYIFDDYAKWTDNVAQYPVTAEPYYLALGIADELGELLSAPADKQLDEAGDVLWYCARYAVKVLGANFSAVVDDALKLPEPVADPFVAAGTICGIEKKRIRDGANWNMAKLGEKQEAAYKALVNLVQFVGWMLYDSSSNGHTLADAVQANIAKLGARLDKGTIKGDGDNR